MSVYTRCCIHMRQGSPSSHSTSALSRTQASDASTGQTKIASSSCRVPCRRPPLLPPPTPFVLLVVADGMGGRGHGRTASRLAVQSLVASMSSSLRTQHSALESLLALLSAAVQHANPIL